MTYARDRRRKQQRNAREAFRYSGPDDPTTQPPCYSSTDYLENNSLITKMFVWPNLWLNPNPSRPWPDPTVT